MKTAVMYGAGNIGRGFIGALLSQSGYEVIFIDVVKEVIDQINKDHSYTVRKVTGQGYEDQKVLNVRAIDGNNIEMVTEAISECEIMATSVGARVLKFIAPNIAKGLQLRLKKKNGPLNLLICENLMDADRYIRNLLEEHLSKEELEQMGLIETSIGRMVPIQTEEMREGDMLRVCVEPYGFLPVDKDAFKGTIPELNGILPFSPFHFYLERKLYLHNMAHAVQAYLGMYMNLNTIDECIDNPYIRMITTGAMQESVLRLSEKYQDVVTLSELYTHMNDLLYRFTNPALGQTCERVGADIPRKLAANDRLVGAAMSVFEGGKMPMYICTGIAAALWAFLKQNAMEQTEQNAAIILQNLSGLKQDHCIFESAIQLYSMLKDGKSLKEILCCVEIMLHEATIPIA